MNNLQIFKNKEFGEIQIVEENGKFEFGATETAKMLGYTNPHKAIIDHCKRDGLTKREVTDSLGRKQEKNFIDEGNLYRLITHSKLPSAEKFESWVFDEVLPSIRKTGGYIAGEENMTEDELVLKAIEVMQRKVKHLEEKTERLATENSMQFQLIGELKPKADYLDKILKSKSIVPVSYIAKDYGMSAKTFNKKLHELGIQYKIGDTWLLYSKYQACGYTHGKITEFYRTDGTLDTKTTMEWTQKGRLFLYELLKKNNIIPTIEKEVI